VGCAVSLLALCAVLSLTCPTHPTGVSHLALHSTYLRRESNKVPPSNNLLEKSF
jgi:hypothetical protein